jgi:hypothetical protein
MATQSKATQIDPRGPRFGAAITSVLLTAVIVLGVPSAALPVLDSAFWLLLAVALLFAWGVVFGPARHPYSALFRIALRPRLSPPDYLEDQAPPRFAQLIGLLVSTAGIVLHLAGVGYGLIVAAAIALVAAFLNAAFGLCLGCEMYNLLLRLRPQPRKR